MKRRAVKKYFQDPVYGQIAVESPLLLALIDSRAVQRMKHIRQLGVSYFTFLGADHSRFSHSLGCMAVMARVLAHLEAGSGLALSPEERELAMAAALLHDVGHCAFSHTLENVLGHDHESMTARLLSEDPQLRGILGSKAAKLARLFKGPRPSGTLGTIKDLISSQLDVDRLDYLGRDAHYTGVNSGQVDLSRIIASLTLGPGGRLRVTERGVLAIEEYFLARYFMYWKVYLHKTSRGLELILKNIIRRAKQLHAAGSLEQAGLTPALRALFELGDKAPLGAFLDHDDSDVMVGIKSWQYGSDPILSDLSGRFLNRRKFRLLREARSPKEDLSVEKRRKIRAYFERLAKGSSSYYFLEDSIGTLPYDPKEGVTLQREDGRVEDLALRSHIIRDITRRLVRARYYVPMEHAAKLRRILEGAL
ncbi:MAG: HD domain-containing protein [candidate division FCPU426 bacterium]